MSQTSATRRDGRQRRAKQKITEHGTKKKIIKISVFRQRCLSPFHVFYKTQTVSNTTTFKFIEELSFSFMSVMSVLKKSKIKFKLKHDVIEKY